MDTTVVQQLAARRNHQMHFQNPQSQPHQRKPECAGVHIQRNRKRQEEKGNASSSKIKHIKLNPSTHRTYCCMEEPEKFVSMECIW
jgi:hypothetical protein